MGIILIILMSIGGVIERCGYMWHPINMTGPKDQSCWYSRSDYDEDGDIDLYDFALAQINQGPICFGPCCCVSHDHECD